MWTTLKTDMCETYLFGAVEVLASSVGTSGDHNDTSHHNHSDLSFNIHSVVMQYQSPTGQMMNVQVPAGVQPGQQFQFQG